MVPYCTAALEIENRFEHNSCPEPLSWEYPSVVGHSTSACDPQLASGNSSCDTSRHACSKHESVLAPATLKGESTGREQKAQVDMEDASTSGKVHAIPSTPSSSLLSASTASKRGPPRGKGLRVLFFVLLPIFLPLVLGERYVASHSGRMILHAASHIRFVNGKGHAFYPIHLLACLFSQVFSSICGWRAESTQQKHFSTALITSGKPASQSSTNNRCQQPKHLSASRASLIWSACKMRPLLLGT